MANSLLPRVEISGVSIRQDDQGRYSLNDLHRAAGSEKRHAPSYWLDTQQTQALIAEIGKEQTTGNPVVSLEGRNGGTYVCKELVYSYAMWISAAFNLKVIRTFDAVVSGDAKPANDPQISALKLSRLAMTAARAFGFKGNMAALSADHAVRAITGASPLLLMGVTHLAADPRGRTYTPTDLGKAAIPPVSAIKINQLLLTAGLQVHDIKGGWQPTSAAQELCEWLDTGKRHSDGTPVKQLKWFSTAMDTLGLEYNLVREVAA